MQLNPNRSLQPKKFLEYEKNIDKLLLQYILDLIKKPNLSICDVGGASGIILNEILSKSKYDVKASLLEVDDFYRDKIINEKINFIHGSILDKKIKDSSFDVVIFNLILHHIIAKSLKKTFQIQQSALNELFRVTKKGGFVVIKEEVNQVRVFSWLVFLLSKIANKLRIKIKTFDVENVVVSFLNKEAIHSIIEQCKKTYNLEIVKYDYWRSGVPIKWRLTLLMNKIGMVIYVIKVLK